MIDTIKVQKILTDGTACPSHQHETKSSTQIHEMTKRTKDERSHDLTATHLKGLGTLS